jgi:cytochrome d ubiquinol oxidase subunit II
VSALQITWFVLIGFMLTVYAILDGFDLGMGFWLPFAKKDEDRRALLAAIGPFWDGNEVWLITGGGAIFAAFPHVYATIFSGMYLPLMLVLFALMFRAVSIEFRNKTESEPRRKFWDVSFAAGSILPAFLFGVATGNVLRGMRIDDMMNYAGGFLDLLNPYAILVGLLSLSVFAMQGAAFAAIKTNGELAARTRSWVGAACASSFAVFACFFFATVITQPHLLENYYDNWFLWILPFATLVAILVTYYSTVRGSPSRAFGASSFAIAALMATMGAMLFPNTVISFQNQDLNLTVANSSSSPLTLEVMLVIAIIGMPLVIGYHVWSYRTFRKA